MQAPSLRAGETGAQQWQRTRGRRKAALTPAEAPTGLQPAPGLGICEGNFKEIVARLSRAFSFYLVLIGSSVVTIKRSSFSNSRSHCKLSNKVPEHSWNTGLNITPFH